VTRLDIHIKFHEDRYKRSSTIKVLLQQFENVCNVDINDGDLYVKPYIYAKFHHNWFKQLRNITTITAKKYIGCNVGITNRGDF
jgi:hypothetical protein